MSKDHVGDIRALVFENINVEDNLKLIEQQAAIDSLNKAMSQKAFQDSLAAEAAKKSKVLEFAPEIPFNLETAQELKFGSTQAVDHFEKIEELSGELDDIKITEEERGALIHSFGSLPEVIDIVVLNDLNNKATEINSQLYGNVSKLKDIKKRGEKAGLTYWNVDSGNPYAAMSGKSDFGKEVDQFEKDNINPIKQQMLHYTPKGARGPATISRTSGVLSGITSRINFILNQIEDEKSSYDKIVSGKVQEL